MTPKSPVYHRTSDGRKVVIVEQLKQNKPTFLCFDVETRGLTYYCVDELTPWVEPETRTVYVHWIKANNEIRLYGMAEVTQKYFKAIKKITITEGEFDE